MSGLSLRSRFQSARALHEMSFSSPQSFLLPYRPIGIRIGRSVRAHRVYALFRKNSKSPKQQVETADLVVKESSKTQETENSSLISPKRFYESLPTGPLRQSQLVPKSWGTTIFSGAFLAFCLYLIYLVFFKDHRMIMEKIEFDMNCIMNHMKEIREKRGDSEMTEAETLRVRSFLLSLMISGNKEDPVHTVNNTLRLTGSQPLSQGERVTLLQDPALSGPIINQSSTKAADASHHLTETPCADETSVNASPIQEASKGWWKSLPYICVLRMKKTGALFMANIGPVGHPQYAIVGFEDPEEGLIAGRIPLVKQLWGVPSQMRKTGVKPIRPIEDEKHFDLTWLSPDELQILFDTLGCFAVVVPAGTLRTGIHGDPVAPGEVLPKIMEVCCNEKYGYQEGNLQNTPTMKGDAVFEHVAVNGVHSDKKLESEVAIHDSDIAVNGAVEKPHYVNGDHGVGRVSEDGDGDEHEPWWMKLDQLIVPKLKAEGEEGGNVEINISIIKEEEDFRPVLFEDQKDAKLFLGVLGKLTGPNTLVAILSESPAKFLKHNHKVDKKKVAVLCKGSLLLDKTANKERLRNAVRTAHVATEIKKEGRSTNAENLDESSVDGRSLKVAETVVANFQKRMQINESEKRKKGDENYLDPMEGILQDLDAGGLDTLLGEDSTSNGDHFGFRNGSHDTSGLYQDFVERMNAEISGQMQQFHQQDEKHEDSESSEVELVADLDELVHQHASSSSSECDPGKSEQDPADDIEVVYPEVIRNGDGNHRRGADWFLGETVIFLPQYLTKSGESTFLAFSSHDLDKKFVVGFQDQTEAQVCRELMKQWCEKEHVASRVIPMEPKALLEFCEEFESSPIILRSASIKLSAAMSKSEFFQWVTLIATTQSSDFSIFNG